MDAKVAGCLTVLFHGAVGIAAGAVLRNPALGALAAMETGLAHTMLLGPVSGSMRSGNRRTRDDGAFIGSTLSIAVASPILAFLA